MTCPICRSKNIGVQKFVWNRGPPFDDICWRIVCGDCPWQSDESYNTVQEAAEAGKEQ